MGKRAFLLGTTGVDKSTVLQRITDYRRKRHDYDISKLATLDFEREFVRPDYDLHSYLDANANDQRSIWRGAWQKLMEFVNGNPDKDIILAMHGVLVRPLYGTRSPLDIGQLKQFEPTSIVTLIDDVYTKWHRTEERAAGREYKGRPSLMALLDARRDELFLGDVLASNLSSTGQNLTNYAVAVHHPVRVLDRLIFGTSRPKSYYLSFPISGPRRLAAEGDPEGINEVDDFLRCATQFEKNNDSAVCFCPLTIDELPLRAALDASDPDGDLVCLKRGSRWDVRQFYSDESLLTDPDVLPKELNLPRKDVAQAIPLLQWDVRLRDYRLVLQSRNLVVFNPIFDGKKTGGVENEIYCALNHLIPVHIFQDPKRDPEAQAQQAYSGKGGSLGERPTDDYVTFYPSLEEMFGKLSSA